MGNWGCSGEVPVSGLLVLRASLGKEVCPCHDNVLNFCSLIPDTDSNVGFSLGTSQWAGEEAKYPFLAPCMAAKDVSASLAPSTHLLETARRALFLKCDVMRWEPSASLHDPSSATGENEQ